MEGGWWRTKVQEMLQNLWYGTPYMGLQARDKHPLFWQSLRVIGKNFDTKDRVRLACCLLSRSLPGCPQYVVEERFAIPIGFKAQQLESTTTFWGNWIEFSSRSGAEFACRNSRHKSVNGLAPVSGSVWPHNQGSMRDGFIYTSSPTIRSKTKSSISLEWFTWSVSWKKGTMIEEEGEWL